MRHPSRRLTNVLRSVRSSGAPLPQAEAEARHDAVNLSPGFWGHENVDVSRRERFEGQVRAEQSARRLDDSGLAPGTFEALTCHFCRVQQAANTLVVMTASLGPVLRNPRNLRRDEGVRDKRRDLVPFGSREERFLAYGVVKS